MATHLLIKLIHHTIEVFDKTKASKTEMQKRLDKLLTNLMDYSKMNKNDKYMKQTERETKKWLKIEKQKGKLH